MFENVEQNVIEIAILHATYYHKLIEEKVPEMLAYQ